MTGEAEPEAAGTPLPESGRASCPHCSGDVPSDANFCPACGGALQGPPCPACGAASGGADRFCTQCGASLPVAAGGAAKVGTGGAPLQGQPPRARTPLGAPASGWSRSGTRAGAAVVVGALAVVAAVVVFRAGGPGEPATDGVPASPPSSAPAPLGPTSAVDLSSMTPREAALRLFNRVMTAVEAGNQNEADRFLPMAVAAFDRVGPLTLDDRFHLSLLHAAAGAAAQALAVAEEGLAVRPTHLLCLSAAAQAALALGDSARAESHYRSFVDAYDAEIQTGLTEYVSMEEGHPDLLAALLVEAREYLAGAP